MEVITPSHHEVTFPATGEAQRNSKLMSSADYKLHIITDAYR